MILQFPETYIGQRKIFLVSKIKNTFPWTYVISDVNGEPIAGSFYEKELQKIVKNDLG